MAGLLFVLVHVTSAVGLSQVSKIQMWTEQPQADPCVSRPHDLSQTMPSLLLLLLLLLLLQGPLLAP
jgi:hypothetical protein